MRCNCNDNQILPTIEDGGCPFEIGQIQRIFIQRLGNTIANADKVASWTQKLVANDNTKITILPEIFNPAFEAGEEIVVGENSNETPNGRGVKIGEWAGTLTGHFSQIDPTTLTTVKSLECMSGLGIYLVNQDGAIMGRGGDDGLAPIPIGRISVRDYTDGGLEDTTKNEFTIKLSNDWWDDLGVKTLTDGNALTDITVAAGSQAAGE